jgi:hypothetical protein
MGVTLNNLEITMQENVRLLSKHIGDYATLGLSHLKDVQVNYESLGREVGQLQLPQTFEEHIKRLPVFDGKKVSDFNNEWFIKNAPTPPGASGGGAMMLAIENERMLSLEADLNRLIMHCWEGNKLREEDKKLFRKCVSLDKGQWVFIALLNQFRIKNVHAMNSETAFTSMGELLRTLLDEIHRQADSYVAVNVLLLSSTLYYNLATNGGQNVKRFLFEQIAHHPLWKDINFWERAVTQQISKDLGTQQVHGVAISSDESGSLNDEEEKSSVERVQRTNEVVFAILSSLLQEMLTYNLDKSMARQLVRKICSTMTSFPENYLQSMLRKIDDYV